MSAEKIFYKATCVSDAIEQALLHPTDFKYLAGGTDVLVNKFQGNDERDVLIDLTEIESLKKIRMEEEYVRIGSLVKLYELEKSDYFKTHFSALPEAAHLAATPILRKTATLGGNILCENRCIFYNQSEWWREAVGYCLKCEGEICIATGGKKNCFSKFVSDTAPVLIAYDALIEVIDAVGTHQFKLEEIYTGDGLKPRKLDTYAIVTAILLPLNKKYKCIVKKLRPRESADFTSLTTAVSLDENNRIKIALGGVDPKPIVVEGQKERMEELKNSAVKKARIVDNDYYSRIYRKDMISVFLDRSYRELGLV